VSKERARRRALREAERAEAARRNEQRQARASRRRAFRARFSPRSVRYARQGGLLARRRRLQNLLVLGLFLIVQTMAWLVWRSASVSFASLVLSVLVVPVLVTLVFNRRI
jgi:Flp pilus assembly protein TadB